MMRRPCWSVLALAALLSGCGKPTATIKGKVTADGKDVTCGSLVFSPKASPGNAHPGPPAGFDLKEDGTFSVLVDLAGSAAQTFVVRYTPRPSQGKQDRDIPFTGLFPRAMEIEVKPGENVVNIELVPKS